MFKNESNLLNFFRLSFRWNKNMTSIFFCFFSKNIWLFLSKVWWFLEKYFCCIQNWERAAISACLCWLAYMPASSAVRHPDSSSSHTTKFLSWYKIKCQTLILYYGNFHYFNFMNAHEVNNLVNHKPFVGLIL